MEFEPKEHTLLTPIDVPVEAKGDEPAPAPIKVTKVVVQMPRGRQMRTVSRLAARAAADPVNYTDTDMLMDSLQLMSDMPEGGVDYLYPADIKALGDLIGPFLAQALGADQQSSSSETGGSETASQ